MATVTTTYSLRLRKRINMAECIKCTVSWAEYMAVNCSLEQYHFSFQYDRCLNSYARVKFGFWVTFAPSEEQVVSFQNNNIMIIIFAVLRAFEQS